MHAEIKKIGEHGSYAVDLMIAGESFRMRYFVNHRVNALEDARKFSQRIGDAIRRESPTAKGEKR